MDDEVIPAGDTTSFSGESSDMGEADSDRPTDRTEPRRHGSPGPGLTPEKIAEMRERHQEAEWPALDGLLGGPGPAGFCQHCGEGSGEMPDDWRCDAARLLDALDAAERARNLWSEIKALVDTEKAEVERERDDYEEELADVDAALTLLLLSVDAQEPVRRLRAHVRKTIGCPDCGEKFVEGWCPNGHRGIDD